MGAREPAGYAGRTPGPFYRPGALSPGEGRTDSPHQANQSTRCAASPNNNINNNIYELLSLEENPGSSAGKGGQDWTPARGITHELPHPRKARPASRAPCKFFTKPGGCRAGAGCRFAHGVGRKHTRADPNGAVEVKEAARREAATKQEKKAAKRQAAEENKNKNKKATKEVSFSDEETVHEVPNGQQEDRYGTWMSDGLRERAGKLPPEIGAVGAAGGEDDGEPPCRQDTHETWAGITKEKEAAKVVQEAETEAARHEAAKEKEAAKVAQEAETEAARHEAAEQTVQLEAAAKKSTPGNPVELQLAHRWVFWEHRVLPKGGGGLDRAYQHATGFLTECDTVQSFWRALNNIPAPSTFFATGSRPRGKVGGRMVEGWSLFRHGVRPEWEDPANASGAELTVSTDSLAVCDQWWEALAMELVGSTLPSSCELTGARVVDKCRRGSKSVYRLELWFSHQADPDHLKQALTALFETSPSLFKLKQHSSQQPAQPAANRTKDVRALLAKLTPARFERVAPQLAGLLADGCSSTVAAVVAEVRQCSLQTNVFHSMYAELTRELSSVADLVQGVRGDCLAQLAQRTELSRPKAKLAASFAAELCARGLIPSEQMLESLSQFGTGPVEIEVLCGLIGKLCSVELVRPLLQQSFEMLEAELKQQAMPSRLKFMVQDTLKLRIV